MDTANPTEPSFPQPSFPEPTTPDPTIYDDLPSGRIGDAVGDLGATLEDFAKKAPVTTVALCFLAGVGAGFLLTRKR